MGGQFPPAVSEAWEAYDRERLREAALREASAPASKLVPQVLLAERLKQQFLASYNRWCGKRLELTVLSDVDGN